jgi:hypothetical protein
MGLGLYTELPAAKDAKVTRRTRKKTAVNTRLMLFIYPLMRSMKCQIQTKR